MATGEGKLLPRERGRMKSFAATVHAGGLLENQSSRWGDKKEDVVLYGIFADDFAKIEFNGSRDFQYFFFLFLVL